MNLDVAKIIARAPAILAGLTPSNIAVLQFVLAHYADDLTEEAAGNVVTDALACRTITPAAIESATQYLAPLSMLMALVSEKDATKFKADALIEEISAALVKANETLAAQNAAEKNGGKEKDHRRVFAEYFGIHVAARGAINSDLTAIYSEFCPNGKATDFASLDRGVIRDKASAKKLPMITQI